MSVDAILDAFRAGSLPPEIALMQLLLATSSPADVEEAIGAALACLDPGSAEGSRLRELLALHHAHPDAWERVNATAAAIPHGEQHATPEAGVARLAQAFDDAARLSPEASVALYSLGDWSRLASVTEEIARWLRERRLLGPDVCMLDLGCGIGRLEQAIHGEVGRILGIDVSKEMIRIAQQRCAGLENVQFRLTGGLDLAGLADEHFEVVVAVDSFPYLVAAGGDVAAVHIAESARVLRPGGSLAILNYSYRGDGELDRGELRRHAARAGLEIALEGVRPFVRWDATAFLLVRRP